MRSAIRAIVRTASTGYFPIADSFESIIARNGEKGKVVVRKYRPKGLDSSHRMLFELLPLNEDYPVIRSHIDSVELIGTVMEHRKFRKK